MDAHHLQARRNVFSNTSNKNDRTICRMFRSTGSCNYGEDCIFAHVSNDRMIVNPSGYRNMNDMHPKPTNKGNFQRQICRHFSRGQCPFERCKFIHQKGQISEENRDNYAINIQTVEARNTVDPNFSDNYSKTKLCNKWSGPNSCPFNDKCTFAHGEAELRSNCILLSEQQNFGTTSRAINMNDFASNASKQPAPTAAHIMQPEPKVCPFKWNNRKIIGIYGDWIE